MDDNYRAKLDEGMGDLLKDLEGEAREKGDYCKKHDLYIGDAKMCPWCEIDALNEKCSPGDLKASVVATWPMAARRAMMYFQVAEGDAADEIERLRVADSAKSKYIKELRVVNRALNDAQTNNLRRIEELKEQSSYWENVAFNLALGREETSDFLSGHHIITRDQIRKAWAYAFNHEDRLLRSVVLSALQELGIVRCENGEGWVRI